MISVKKYIESNKDRFIEELFSLIRIPSISARHEHKPDMEACAKRWTELLLAAGAGCFIADHLPLNEYDLTLSTVLPAVHFGYDNGSRSTIRKVTCCSEEAPTKPKPPDTF